MESDVRFHLQVEVDIGLSAHANARRWFEQKKKHAVKQDKTVAAHQKAFKAAEKKTLQQLAQVKFWVISIMLLMYWLPDLVKVLGWFTGNTEITHI